MKYKEIRHNEIRFREFVSESSKSFSCVDWIQTGLIYRDKIFIVTHNTNSNIHKNINWYNLLNRLIFLGYSVFGVRFISLSNPQHF